MEGSRCWKRISLNSLVFLKSLSPPQGRKQWPLFPSPNFCELNLYHRKHWGLLALLDRPTSHQYPLFWLHRESLTICYLLRQSSGLFTILPSIIPLSSPKNHLLSLWHISLSWNKVYKIVKSKKLMVHRWSHLYDFPLSWDVPFWQVYTSVFSFIHVFGRHILSETHKVKMQHPKWRQVL